MCNANIGKSDRGQTIVVFALVLPILILFAGLAIDAGLLYVTKAKLSTSVDAACLTGMKSLALGQTTAGQVATDMFQANFGPNPPTPTITFPTDTYGNQQVKVTATAYVHTLFMRDLSQWASVPVSDTAVATRGKLVMSIVLDRSGSMSSDGGETALKSAVPIFVGDFDNTTDEVAMISFSSNATVDRAINYNFITPIDTAVSGLKFTGGTFGTGAGAGAQAILSTTIGAPLSLAQLQNDSVTIQPGQNVIKVVVYFTDGLMNTVQDNFYCLGKSGNGTTQTLINYGGYDPGTSEVDFFDPTSATIDWCPYQGYGSCEGGTILTTGFPYDAKNDICKDKTGALVTGFTAQNPALRPNPVQFLRANVTAEAQYRAIQTAIAMRTESPVPTYIFSIGLGSGVTTTTQAFLAQLANDPSYPATYISGQPAGEFFYIPSCTGSALTTCTTQLNTAFQTIAAKVLLRLTQ